MNLRVTLSHAVVAIGCAVLVMSCNRATDSQDDSSTLQSQPPSLFPVRVDGKFGYIDCTGELVLRPQFDLASEFHEDRATVMIRSEDGQQLYAIIDSKGETILDLQANGIGLFAEGRAVFVDEQTGKRGYVDSQGVIVVPAIFDTASDFRNGVAHVREIAVDEKEALRRAAGALSRIPPSKADTAGWNDLGIPVQHYYIDRSGARLDDIDVDDEEPARWALVRDADEPRVRKQDGKYGFVDGTGKFIIEPRFEAASEFSEGLAAVRIDERWGFINRAGMLVISPKWTFAGRFRGGLAQVNIQSGQDGYISMAGEYVWQPSK